MACGGPLWLQPAGLTSCTCTYTRDLVPNIRTRISLTDSHLDQGRNPIGLKGTAMMKAVLRGPTRNSVPWVYISWPPRCYLHTSINPDSHQPSTPADSIIQHRHHSRLSGKSHTGRDVASSTIARCISISSTSSFGTSTALHHSQDCKICWQCHRPNIG